MTDTPKMTSSSRANIPLVSSEQAFAATEPENVAHLGKWLEHYYAKTYPEMRPSLAEEQASLDIGSPDYWYLKSKKAKGAKKPLYLQKWLDESYMDKKGNLQAGSSLPIPPTGGKLPVALAGNPLQMQANPAANPAIQQLKSMQKPNALVNTSVTNDPTLKAGTPPPVPGIAMNPIGNIMSQGMQSMSGPKIASYLVGLSSEAQDVINNIVNEGPGFFCTEPAIKQADIDWQNVLQEVKNQLPKFHGFESTIGALGGAGAGGLYHLLANESPEDKKKHPTANKVRLLTRLLGGALAGGAVTNIAGDRVRRYLSNLSTMSGYDPKFVLSGITRGSWKDVLSRMWQGGVLDRPTPIDKEDYLADATTKDWGANALMRRELLRRALNVSEESDPDNWFRNVGSIELADGKVTDRVGINKRLLDQTTGKLLVDPKFGKSWMDALIPHPIVVEPNGRARSDVLGSTPVERYGPNVERLNDSWQFGLNHDEDNAFITALKRAILHPATLNDNLYPATEGAPRLRPYGQQLPTTWKEALKAYTMRKFFNSFIANKTPVFDQVLYMPEYQKHLAGPDSPFPTHFTGQVSDQPIYAVPHESLTQGTGIDDVAVDKLLNGRQFTPYK